MTTTATNTPKAAKAPHGPPHPLAEFVTYFAANRGAIIGLGTIVVLVVLGAFAGVFGR